MVIFVPVNTDEQYMHRCLELAKLGGGNVAPNPMVGAVLVHDGRIIGEGYHAIFGGPHAEVNCINSVADADKALISSAALYVSLEPCCHQGKTPPCTDLIIRHQIRKVVIGSRDPFPAMNGSGVDRLREHGVQVTENVLNKECAELNRRFFTFHTANRPYVLLKWAQTADGKISSGNAERLMISNEFTNRLVHRWRSEEAAILVGTSTALLDNPTLNVRHWNGPDPVRIVIDKDLSLPGHLRLFDGSQRTVIFNTLKHQESETMTFYQVTSDTSLVHQVLNACVRLGISSVMVEGGATLLQSFIDDDCWDEARVITNNTLFAPAGMNAPVLSSAVLWKQEQVANDAIGYFRRHG